jgi:uncharacterized protein YbaR (Trm112 family)
MSLAVVRCPACRGPSRVAVDALGQMVACPRCQSPFVAVEEAQLVSAASTPAYSARPAAAQPLAPRRRRRPRPVEAEPAEPATSPGDATSPAVPDPEHDPHRPPVAGLPVSVLIGLALLPFGIPLLWFITPLLTGKEAALSLAVPISLAISASALCLGVVYTIDWTAATRIKGVFMLVGLSYLGAAGLYFLKKDMMDAVRGFFSPATDWAEVRSQEGNFRVRMPGTPKGGFNDQPLQDVTMADGWKAQHKSEFFGVYHYLATSGKPAVPLAQADDAWFAKVREHLEANAGKASNEQPKTYTGDRADFPGREWEFKLPDDKIRIVRVYVINGRVYYLSVEGPRLDAEDDHAEPFFRSFRVNP